MLKLQQRAPKPTVAFCMGDIGFPSRFLALKYGAPLIYAAFNKERGIAPGMPSFEEFKHDLPGPVDRRRDTQVFGVIGDPVGAQPQPDPAQPHVPAARRSNAIYLPFRVPRGELPEAV